MNYYPHHIGDFNNATRHLTRIERCVYRELIELYYDTEEPLINDISYLCRRILATSEQESAAVKQVLTEFFILDNNEEFFVNARCEKVIKEYQSNKKNKSKAGKASARSRKALKLKEKEGLTPVEQPLNSRTTDEQLTNNQNQEPKPEPEPIKDKTLVDSQANTTVPTPAENVFHCWQSVMNHKQAKLDDKRKKIINQALKTGYSVMDLTQAIQGCSMTPHNMGKNSNNQRYDGLHIILKPENIDRFIANGRPKDTTEGYEAFFGIDTPSDDLNVIDGEFVNHE